MPPKRSQARKRATRTADEGPSAQQSRRQSTRNATLASQATASVRAEAEASAVLPSNVPSTTTQRLDPELVKSLVSTVAEEVTRQLTATLASPLGTHTPSVAPHVSEPTEESHPSAPSSSGVSATTLVEGAIAAAHSQITGAPQLLPTNIVTQARSQPSQTFLSAGLPIDSQVSTKIKEKFWNEQFVDFGVLFSNPGQDKYYPLLGMKWRGLYYYDRCMPTGCSSSCKTFEVFSTAIEWIAQHKFDVVDNVWTLCDHINL